MVEYSAFSEDPCGFLVLRERCDSSGSGSSGKGGRADDGARCGRSDRAGGVGPTADAPSLTSDMHAWVAVVAAAAGSDVAAPATATAAPATVQEDGTAHSEGDSDGDDADDDDGRCCRLLEGGIGFVLRYDRPTDRYVVVFPVLPNANKAASCWDPDDDAGEPRRPRGLNRQWKVRPERIRRASAHEAWRGEYALMTASASASPSPELQTTAAAAAAGNPLDDSDRRPGNGSSHRSLTTDMEGWLFPKADAREEEGGGGEVATARVGTEPGTAACGNRSSAAVAGSAAAVVDAAPYRVSREGEEEEEEDPAAGASSNRAPGRSSGGGGGAATPNAPPSAKAPGWSDAARNRLPLSFLSLSSPSSDDDKCERFWKMSLSDPERVLGIRRIALRRCDELKRSLRDALLLRLAYYCAALAVLLMWCCLVGLGTYCYYYYVHVAFASRSGAAATTTSNNAQPDVPTTMTMRTNTSDSNNANVGGGSSATTGSSIEACTEWLTFNKDDPLRNRDSLCSTGGGFGLSRLLPWAAVEKDEQRCALTHAVVQTLCEQAVASSKNNDTATVDGGGGGDPQERFLLLFRTSMGLQFAGLLFLAACALVRFARWSSAVFPRPAFTPLMRSYLEFHLTRSGCFLMGVPVAGRSLLLRKARSLCNAIRTYCLDGVRRCKNRLASVPTPAAVVRGLSARTESTFGDCKNDVVAILCAAYQKVVDSGDYLWTCLTPDRDGVGRDRGRVGDGNEEGEEKRRAALKRKARQCTAIFIAASCLGLILSTWSYLSFDRFKHTASDAKDTRHDTCQKTSIRPCFWPGKEGASGGSGKYREMLSYYRRHVQDPFEARLIRYYLPFLESWEENFVDTVGCVFDALCIPIDDVEFPPPALVRWERGFSDNVTGHCESLRSSPTPPGDEAGSAFGAIDRKFCDIWMYVTNDLDWTPATKSGIPRWVVDKANNGIGVDETKTPSPSARSMLGGDAQNVGGDASAGHVGSAQKSVTPMIDSYRWSYYLVRDKFGAKAFLCTVGVATATLLYYVHHVKKFLSA